MSTVITYPQYPEPAVYGLGGLSLVLPPPIVRELFDLQYDTTASDNDRAAAITLFTSITANVAVDPFGQTFQNYIQSLADITSMDDVQIQQLLDDIQRSLPTGTP